MFVLHWIDMLGDDYPSHSRIIANIQWQDVNNDSEFYKSDYDEEFDAHESYELPLLPEPQENSEDESSGS